MASLRDIKKRITSVQSTRQVTRTMEMVSTAKIRKAQENIERARPYAIAIGEMLGNVTKAATSVSHPLLNKRDDVKKTAIIAIASDRGQAGGFNSSVIHLTEQTIAERRDAGVEIDLIAVGKKLKGYFSYRGIHPNLLLEGYTGAPRFSDAKEIAERVTRMYIAEEIDEVVIIYNRFVNVAVQRIESMQLLPIEQKHIEEAKAEASKREADYIFEPSAEQVLQTLLPAYVEALIFRALMESAASEHGARRTAMKSATDNATEMIGTLSRSYNRARQAAITTEISEIIGGAAALEG